MADNAPAVDYRRLLMEREEERNQWLHALITDYALRAVHRLTDELPASASYAEVAAKYRALHREEVIKAGAKWPEKLTPADQELAGTAWRIFPNTVFLPGVDGALWYRARQNGDDRNSCIYDIWSLQRYAPGQEPKVEHKFFPSVQAFEGVNPFLQQDFDTRRRCSLVCNRVALRVR